MKDAQKPGHVGLNTLIGWLKEGRFAIPDFQRDFEWKPSDIQDLMRSILLDYYIGSLLLWKGKEENFEALSCEPMYGQNGTGNPMHIVLDGQQRLTALYYVLFAPEVNLPNRASRYVYFVNVDKFMEEEHDEAFFYWWAPNRIKSLLNDRERQFSEHIFPLSVIGSGGWDLFTWVQGYEQHWSGRAEKAKEANDAAGEQAARRHAANAHAFGDHIREITEQYQISYIELDQDIAVDKVCDIFTQINSRGVRLDIFDLINALLKPKGLQLKHMWREVAPQFEFVETEKMNVYVLQIMSILRQQYCSPKYLYFLLPGQKRQVRDPDGTRRQEVMVADTQDFQKRWNQAVGSLKRAINLLRQPQEFGVVSPKFLPYASILPAFSALQTEITFLPASQQLEAQRKVRHWYWASVFLSRYSGAVESTSARDFGEIKHWFHNGDTEPWMIQNFQSSFRNMNLRAETARGSSVYKGIFNLLVIKGARDWISGNIPQHDEIDDHHIVPASWGSENLPGGLVHTILNRTPLTAETNRKVIRDRLPNTYLPEMIEQNGEKAVLAMLESHFISSSAMQILLRDPFTPNDFEAFIAERRRTIEEAIEDLVIKERIDLSPKMRELDERVEKVELGVRGVIDTVLEGDPELLPPHVKQKLDERIQKAAKKNAAFDENHYESLDGKLEFCDLRELQDAITNKASWQYFQPRFANKETVISRFDQLAELRNGIRHSRTVDEVTRKEGEAAAIWFEQVLDK